MELIQIARPPRLNQLGFGAERAQTGLASSFLWLGSYGPDKVPSHRVGRMGARRIYEVLRDQILGRVYGSNGSLPSSRALAEELGVSRGTVTVAYEQLAAEGFIETRHGARPRVAKAVVETGRTGTKARSSTRKARVSRYGERFATGRRTLNRATS